RQPGRRTVQAVRGPPGPGEGVMMDVPTARPDEVSWEHKPYTPVGSSLALMYARETEVLLSGPAGTGKSRACLAKLHLVALKYPGMRGCIVRKTRESLTESALVTFERDVVPEGHPILGGARRNARQAYSYPNGSVIVVGGLKQAGKDQ